MPCPFPTRRPLEHLLLAAALLLATTAAAPSLAASITAESGQAYLRIEYLGYDEEGFEYVAARTREADPTSSFDLDPSYYHDPELHGEVGPDHLRYHGGIESFNRLDTNAFYQLDLSFTGGAVRWQGATTGCIYDPPGSSGCAGDRIALESIDEQGAVLAVLDEYVSDGPNTDFVRTLVLPAGRYRLSGSFLVWDIGDYTSFDVSLDVLVPEPGTGVLVVSGILACAAGRGRRRRGYPAQPSL